MHNHSQLNRLCCFCFILCLYENIYIRIYNYTQFVVKDNIFQLIIMKAVSGFYSMNPSKKAP